MFDDWALNVPAPGEGGFATAVVWALSIATAGVEDDGITVTEKAEETVGFAAAGDDVTAGEGTGIRVVATEGFDGDWKNSPPLPDVVVVLGIALEDVLTSMCWT